MTLALDAPRSCRGESIEDVAQQRQESREQTGAALITALVGLSGIGRLHHQSVPVLTAGTPKLVNIAPLDVSPGACTRLQREVNAWRENS
jgi:hypothetical protein